LVEVIRLMEYINNVDTNNQGSGKNDNKVLVSGIYKQLFFMIITRENGYE
jgi:hypothetical protein